MIYVKISFISSLIFFLVFKHDFIRCVDFTHIAAANTASNDVTNSTSDSLIRMAAVLTFQHQAVATISMLSVRSHIKYLIQTLYIVLLIL